MAYTVRLEKGIIPKFPSRCVICNQSYDFRANTSQNKTTVQNLLRHRWRDAHEFDIPIHLQCAHKLRNKIFWLNVSVLLIITVAMVVVLLLVIVTIPVSETAIIWIVALIAGSLIVLWEKYQPLEFDCKVGFGDAETGALTYEFENMSYGIEFEKLNGPVEEYSEWQKEMALYYFWCKDFETVIEYADKYIEANPQDYLGFKIRSRAFKKMGRFERSLRDEERSKALATRKRNFQEIKLN